MPKPQQPQLSIANITRKAKDTEPADTVLVRDVILSMENDGSFHTRTLLPFQKNQVKHYRGANKSKYDEKGAETLWGRCYKLYAAQYAKDTDVPIQEITAKANVNLAASILRKSFEAEADLGNYDEYLSKKDQAAYKK